MESKRYFGWLLLCVACLFCFHAPASSAGSKKSYSPKAKENLSAEKFRNPSSQSRPGVYWYFMDGNLSKEGITKDLESMKRAGIGYVIFLEVNVGVPRGPVDFMSDEWLEIFKHIVSESKRLGIGITLGIGPGWTGSGGPWVKGEQSMQHLVSSSVTVKGSGKQLIQLPKPEPKAPYFGSADFSAEMMQNWKGFYEDVAVLAFPSPESGQLLPDSEEKALYYRAPYSSVAGVKQYLPTIEVYDLKTDRNAVVDKASIVDLTSLLKPDGTIEWNVPEGSWTIMRFGSRNNGAVTRPAPKPGIGMECDKFDSLAVKDHLEHFTEKLFKAAGGSLNENGGGLQMLHMDSWEMGAQNWTAAFREEFLKRRGYDPLPFYPVYAGLIVQSREVSERFLWDLRLTSQELILENHAGYVKTYSHKHGLGLSIEPYDMNPTSDLELGAVADVPMCEFWSEGYGFETSFSVIEGTSDAHIIGQPVVPSESFTAANDLWRQYPGSMKNQTDWAFASGINRLMFHTFQHQCLADSLRPGMTMGPYGVHWDRNQTWWPMASAYHDYVSRCQYLLQQGRTVADILYLAPEGAPHVFRAPTSALESSFDSALPDRREYNFDGCPPSLLYSASVKDGSIVFPGGASYRVLVLPDNRTMTPQLLEKISQLAAEGATIIGNRPVKSPSLCEYPACDEEVKKLSDEIWGEGKVIPCGEELDNLYQPYSKTVSILASMKVVPDFVSDSGCIRYTHRTTAGVEIYFLSNRTGKEVVTDCSFRVNGRKPEIWNPMDGSTRNVTTYSCSGGSMTIPLKFEAHESYFIIFTKHLRSSGKASAPNYDTYVAADTLKGSWKVSFDPAWGGPQSVIFSSLEDWSKSGNDGIKHYSGIAEYEKVFSLGKVQKGRKYFLNFDKVCVMAHIWLNGKDMGIIWTNPYRVEITSALKEGDNGLRIEVANLWPNRLIGDLQTENGRRYTFTTYNRFRKGDPLLESGLIGKAYITSAGSFIAGKSKN